MTVSVHHSDCIEWLAAYDGPLFDSVVTDPPYHLTSIVKRFGGANAAEAIDRDGVYKRASRGFMGKTWDGGDIAQRPETWRAVYDALKPGGHLVAFAGTRTYHRMAVAIEEAGFEIRDMLSWNFGAGFPKSHNVFKQLAAKGEACTCHISKLSHHHATEENLRRLQEAVDARDALSGRAQSDVRRGVQGEVDRREGEGPTGAQSNAGNDHLRGLRLAEGNAAGVVQASEQPDMQPPVQRRSAGAGLGEARAQGAAGEDAGKLRERSHEGREQPGVEGRRYAQAATGELQGRSVCEGAGMGAADGAEGRLHHGASSRDGADVRLPADANGSGQPHRSQPREQRAFQPGIVADECGPQAWGGWPVCDGCGKPIIPEGLGTALKPATEPICLARKPLGERTVAANLARYGVGALNIDGCRIEYVDDADRPAETRGKHGSTVDYDGLGDGDAFGGLPAGRVITPAHREGRWPANVVHDGSEEVVAMFPTSTTGVCPADAVGGYSGGLKRRDMRRAENGGDSGSVARFFYSAKAGPLDRIGTSHATVKPVDLMRWLVRLVTPPGGRVLDPFAGSGTTGIACMAEGFDCQMVELEADHVADIERKLAFLRGQGGLSVIEKHKAKRDREAKDGALDDAGPLFGVA